MSPSLKEKYDELFPPSTRDDGTDLEDMVGVKLILKRSIRPDKSVEITSVDLEKDEHRYKIDGGKGITVQESNDADIYQ